MRSPNDRNKKATRAKKELSFSDEISLQTEMLKQRIVRLDGEIDETVANFVTSAIRYLEKEDPTKPIILMINSPGGVISDGMAIVDTIRNCLCPVHTCVYGMAASMASVIMAVGNKRYAAPHAEIMIHQPLGGNEGQQTEIDIHAHDMRNCREELTQIYAEETGLSHEDIDRLLERDFTMTAARAKQLGLIDEIMTQDMYFKLVTGGAVPAWKKPRFPDAKRTKERTSIDEQFNEIASRAAQRRKQAKPSNDNGHKQPSRKKGGKANKPGG